jgi:hypothetical protein
VILLNFLLKFLGEHFERISVLLANVLVAHLVLAAPAHVPSVALLVEFLNRLLPLVLAIDAVQAANLPVAGHGGQLGRSWIRGDLGGVQHATRLPDGLNRSGLLWLISLLHAIHHLVGSSSLKLAQDGVDVLRLLLKGVHLGLLHLSPRRRRLRVVVQNRLVHTHALSDLCYWGMGIVCQPTRVVRGKLLLWGVSS